MYENILIATDGSKQAQPAVNHGLQVADAFDAKVHAVYVIETEATYILTVGLGDDEMEEYREYGEETVTEVVQSASDLGLEGTGVIRTGRISAEIVDYAEDNDIDLIVMGRQGRGAIARYVGSTADKVIRMTDIPVTVVGSD